MNASNGTLPDGRGAVVVVPTYNEAANIGELAARLRHHLPAADLLVVDDASPDGTAALVAEMARARPGVHLLSRSGKQGLGAAYRAGFAWALDRGYQRIVQMDADLSHDPADVPALLTAADGCGVAIGSRFVRGGGIIGWPRRRWLLSRSANLYAQLLLRLPVRDLTGGFKCWRAELLAALEPDSLAAAGYVFQVETTWRALRLGFTAREVPIVFRERLRGASKMGPAVAFEGLFRLPALVAGSILAPSRQSARIAGRLGIR